MAKIDQNHDFFFILPPFISGIKFSLFLHSSNAEKLVENETRERRPLGTQQGGPKGPKIAKIDQNPEYFLFCSYPVSIQSGNTFSLFFN